MSTQNRSEKVSLNELKIINQDNDVLQLVDAMLPIAGILLGDAGKSHFTRLNDHSTSSKIYDTAEFRIFRDYGINIPLSAKEYLECSGTSISFYPYGNNFASENRLPPMQLIAALIDQSELQMILKSTSVQYKMSSYKEHNKRGAAVENLVIESMENAGLVMQVLPPPSMRDQPFNFGNGQLYFSQAEKLPIIFQRDGSFSELPIDIAKNLPVHQEFCSVFMSANIVISSVLNNR